MNPTSTPPEARRITPDCQPVFPCWLWQTRNCGPGGWWWHCQVKPPLWNINACGDNTYWHPDQPTAPTQPPALADRLRLCPVCAKNTVILDGYCGTCRQCTMPPAPLTGGTEAEVQASPELPDCQPVLLRKYRRAMQALHAIALLESAGTDVAEIVRKARQECVDMGDSSEEVDAAGFTNPTIKQLESEVTRLSRIVLERAAPAEVADGCKEGRPVSPAMSRQAAEQEALAEFLENAFEEKYPYPHGMSEQMYYVAGRVLAFLTPARAAVSPATGEREAELRDAVAVAMCADSQTWDYRTMLPLADKVLAALTPLLDRREGDAQRSIGVFRADVIEKLKVIRALEAEREHWRLSSACREKEAELAALRTLVAKKDEALSECAGYFDGPRNADSRGLDLLCSQALALTPATITDELAAKDALIAAARVEIAAERAENKAVLSLVAERDPLTTLAPSEWMHNKLAQLTAAQSALHDWKQWLRLVLAVNAPTDISDDDLRKNIVAAWDKQTLALREAEAARGEDSKRLDWLEASHQGVSHCWSETEQSFWTCNDGKTYISPRAAIDAARAQEAKP